MSQYDELKQHADWLRNELENQLMSPYSTRPRLEHTCALEVVRDYQLWDQQHRERPRSSFNESVIAFELSRLLHALDGPGQHLAAHAARRALDDYNNEEKEQ